MGQMSTPISRANWEEEVEEVEVEEEEVEVEVEEEEKAAWELKSIVKARRCLPVRVFQCSPCFL